MLMFRFNLTKHIPADLAGSKDVRLEMGNVKLTNDQDDLFVHLNQYENVIEHDHADARRQRMRFDIGRTNRK